MAGTNVFQGQIQGPFSRGTELMGLIQQQCASRVKYVSHLGIQTNTDNVVINPGALVTLQMDNGSYNYEIGKTGIYEIGNTKVYSIKFNEDKDNNTIIDYTVVLE